MGLFDFIFKSGLKTNQPQPSVRYTSRLGKFVETDAVFDAWTSGDLRLMLSVLDLKTNLIDRHYLLQCIVERTYKLRKDDSMRKKCKEICEVHIGEFSEIAPALKRELKFLPHVSTFQYYATVLTEDNEFEKAIKVCRMAMAYGLNDGTKSGFEDRIARIKKKAQKGNPPS